jgi:hypothetical protein
MNKCTRFEDLSNEILFKTFDYLHVLDIFTGFTSLNKRISSILQLIPLRIQIFKNHSRYQIDLLSLHLTYHAHQVISLEIHDTIRDDDDTSIINLLFYRHEFINLESCTLIEIKPEINLENIIQKIKSLNRLVSFAIYQSVRMNISENDRNELTRTILMHKSPSLRSVVLQHHYHYLDISNYPSIASNLTSLYLSISGSSVATSLYSILSILHLCHRIRNLAISLEDRALLANYDK